MIHGQRNDVVALFSTLDVRLPVHKFVLGKDAVSQQQQHFSDRQELQVLRDTQRPQRYLQLSGLLITAAGGGERMATRRWQRLIVHITILTQKKML